MSVTNIAAYRFVDLDALDTLREQIHAQAQALALRGTVLLAPEGINLFLAGTAQAIDAFLQWLRSDTRFADLPVKVSHSDTVPFQRLRVRIKREIIRMDHPDIRPSAGRAAGVSPATLHAWLKDGRDAAGREVVLLDTRNGFEVDAGTFTGAVDMRIARFTQFPEAVQAQREALAGKTVVTFCTGGIRCEKAALYMTQAGFEHVYQLEGGILQYFEDTDGAGFTGECFVFDERIGVDAALTPTN